MSKSEEKKYSRRTFISGTVGGLVVGAAAGGLAGYSLAPPTVGPAGTATATVTASPGATKAKDVLLHACFHDPTSFDPHVGANDEPTFRYTSNLYETLVEMVGAVSPSVPWIQIEPHLATNWTASSDGKEYLFEIRRGVKFHDGSTLDANAVKYSFDRATAIARSLAGLAIQPYFSGAEVTGNYEVRVTLSAAYSPFILVLPGIYIVNPTVVEANIKQPGDYGAKGDYGTLYLESHDAGSGPYIMKERRPSELTVYEAFPDYWGGFTSQYFDELDYSIIAETTTIVSELKAHQIDMTDYWLPDDAITALETVPGVQVPTWAGDFAGTYTLLLNNQNQFLQNKALRQALNYAFDYGTNLKSIYAGKGALSTGPIPPGMIGYDPSLVMYTRDIDKAKALMAQSGFKPGEVTLDCMWSAGMDVRKYTTLLMQQNFAEIGVNLTLKEMPWSDMISYVGSHDPKDSIAIIHLGGSLAFPDPDDVLTRFYSSKVWEPPPDGQGIKTYYSASFYKNDQVDKLLEDARVAPTLSERDAMYKQVCSILVEDAVSIWPIWNYIREPMSTEIVPDSIPQPFHFTNVKNHRRNNWYRVKS